MKFKIIPLIGVMYLTPETQGSAWISSIKSTIGIPKAEESRDPTAAFFERVRDVPLLDGLSLTFQPINALDLNPIRMAPPTLPENYKQSNDAVTIIERILLGNPVKSEGMFDIKTYYSLRHVLDSFDTVKQLTEGGYGRTISSMQNTFFADLLNPKKSEALKALQYQRTALWRELGSIRQIYLDQTRIIEKTPATADTKASKLAQLQRYYTAKFNEIEAGFKALHADVCKIMPAPTPKVMPAAASSAIVLPAPADDPTSTAASRRSSDGTASTGGASTSSTAASDPTTVISDSGIYLSSEEDESSDAVPLLGAEGLRHRVKTPGAS